MDDLTQEKALKEINENLSLIESNYPELRKEKAVLDSLSTYIKDGFKELLRVYEEKGEEVKKLNFNGVVVQAVTRKEYKYNDEFKKELMDLGYIAFVLTDDDSMTKRFDLTDYMYVEEDAKKWLHNSTRKTPEEKASELKKIEESKDEWNKIKFEDLVSFYIRYKNMYEINSAQKFEPYKKKLIQLMDEYDVKKAGKFSIQEPEKKINFFSLAKDVGNKVFLEKVAIATNGYDVVDLINFKYRKDIDPSNLIDGKVIKKKYGSDKVEKLKEMLGEDFYYMEGLREEPNILKRFGVSHSKVEELVDDGRLLANEVFGRELVKANVVIEIIDEITDKKRKEDFFEKSSKRRVENSLYMEEEMRNRHKIVEKMESEKFSKQ